MTATDPRVRAEVYRFLIDRGRPPVPAELAMALDLAQAQVEESLQRLAGDHLLVLAPGTSYVWMANPFSALPTAYSVEAGGRHWFGNCIWDGLGILAVLGTGGVVRTWCPDCLEPMAVAVDNDEVVEPNGVVHYAIPASRWWDDIGFN